MANNAELPQKVLIIDDQPLGLGELKRFLESNNIQALSAPDLQSALYLFGHHKVDVAVIAIEMKELSGISIVQKIRGNEDLDKKCAGVVLMSAKRERTATEQNLVDELGGIEIMNKPFKPVQLLPYLIRSFSRMKTDRNFAELKEKVVDVHVKKGNYEKAINTLKKNLPQLGEKGPNLLLDLYEQGGFNEDGLQLVDGLINKNPDKTNINYINAKGRLLMKTGNFEEAKKYMEKADELAPMNLERMGEMAELYLKMDNPEKSIEKMKGLMQENPEQPDMKFGMFDKLKEAGYSDHAIAFCKETTQANEVVRFYNNQGVMESKSGDYSKAIQKYADALQFYPKYKENYRILFNKALAEINAKEPGYIQRAIEAVEASLELSPDYEKAINLLEKLKNSKKKKKPKKAG